MPLTTNIFFLSNGTCARPGNIAICTGYQAKIPWPCKNNEMPGYLLIYNILDSLHTLSGVITFTSGNNSNRTHNVWRGTEVHLPSYSLSISLGERISGPYQVIPGTENDMARDQRHVLGSRQHPYKLHLLPCCAVSGTKSVPEIFVQISGGQ